MRQVSTNQIIVPIRAVDHGDESFIGGAGFGNPEQPEANEVEQGDAADTNLDDALLSDSEIDEPEQPDPRQKGKQRVRNLRPAEPVNQSVIEEHLDLSSDDEEPTYNFDSGVATPVDDSGGANQDESGSSGTPASDSIRLRNVVNGPRSTTKNEQGEPRKLTRAVKRPKGLIEDYYTEFTTHGRGYLAVAGVEPRSYKEVIDGPDAELWMKAMQEEIDALVKCGTWSVAELPKNRTAVGSKWTFKIKRDVNGMPIRYKVRLMAQGFTQRPGIDYDEMFAPVARMASVHCLLAIAAAEDMEIRQLDIVTAFLNANLDEEIYLVQPPGFRRGSGVLRLHKSIYGLKQAPNLWNKLIDEWLLHIGFGKCLVDSGIYVKLMQSGPCYLSLHVDDMVIACRSEGELAEIKRAIMERFKAQDLGPISQYLGIEIRRDRKKKLIMLLQRRHITDTLRVAQMEDCKGISLPADPAGQIADTTERTNRPYFQVVGGLQYIATGTRPDICSAVSHASRRSNPTKADWHHVQRILRYLQGTKDLWLVLGAHNPIQLTGFCDADYGGDRITRKSMTGYCFTLGKGMVSWSTRQQTPVALSTGEAEYMALTEAAKEAQWLRALLRSMGHTQANPTTIWEDNQSCIKLTKHNRFHARSKHIDIRYHFVRELIEARALDVEYKPSGEMTADILTKPIPRIRFETHRKNLGIVYL